MGEPSAPPRAALLYCGMERLLKDFCGHDSDAAKCCTDQRHVKQNSEVVYRHPFTIWHPAHDALNRGAQDSRAGTLHEEAALLGYKELSSHFLGQFVYRAKLGFRSCRKIRYLKRHFAGKQQGCHCSFQVVP